MRRLVVILVVALVLIPLSASAQDVVRTKDGGLYRGRIVEESPGVQLMIRDMSGNRHLIKWDNIDRIEPGEWQGKQSKTVSWALSFFLMPGLGQFYNGDKVKGAVMATVGIGSGLALFLGDEDDEFTTGAGVVFLATWVWSFVDAPVRSRSINYQRGYGQIQLTRPQFAITIARFDL